MNNISAETSKMKISIATKQNWKAVIEIYNQAVDEKFCTAYTDHITVVTRSDWLEQHANNNYPIIVCEIGEKVCGWCRLSPYRSGRVVLSKVAEISYYVHKDFRGMKVGDTLVSHSVIVARERDFKNLIAILLEPSINLLKKHSFLL